MSGDRYRLHLTDEEKRGIIPSGWGDFYTEEVLDDEEHNLNYLHDLDEEEGSDGVSQERPKTVR